MVDIKSVESLDLSENRLESTEGLAALVSLRILNLSNNMISQIQNTLPRSLEALNISSNKIDFKSTLSDSSISRAAHGSSNSPFDLLKNLRVLELMKNEITRFPSTIYFSNCHLLSSLDLSHNKIAEDIECLSKISALRELNLGFNKIRKVSVLEQLKGSPIVKLIIVGNYVADHQQSQCEILLTQILPNLENLQTAQLPLKTSKQSQQLKSHNNLGAGRSSVSPLKTQQQNQQLSLTPTSNLKKNILKSTLILNEFTKQQQQQLPSKQINQSNSVSPNRQTEKGFFVKSIPLNDKENRQEQKICQNSEEIKNIHEKCESKLKKLKQAQNMDERLISQQQQIIEMMNLEKERRGEAWYDEQLRKDIKLIQLENKCDIFYSALATIGGFSSRKMDSCISQLESIIATNPQQPFMSSRMKEQAVQIFLENLLKVTAGKE